LEEIKVINPSKTKTPMPEADAKERSGNFAEVALGYTASLAAEEAARCLECRDAPCIGGCPVGIRIPDFIKRLKEGDTEGAFAIISEGSCLPEVCGRVCPQELQCESRCKRGRAGDSVAIGALERYVADLHNSLQNDEKTPPVTQKNGISVAVVGSGPAGLSCAGELAARGFDVTVFEALHELGGVLVYGIPEFRLPKSIVAGTVRRLENMGVKFVKNVIIGKTLMLSELSDMGYSAVFLGTGAGLPVFMNIPGEELVGVYSANEFLTRVNLMHAGAKGAKTPIRVGKHVAVIGGGNVAMDASRCALRLGAQRVSIIYRRGMEELPARREEVEHAVAEGVCFKLLTSPVAILPYEGEDDSRLGTVGAIRCISMQLGEPDARGRRSPVPIEGSECDIEVDTVIMAIGTRSNPLVRELSPSLATNDRGLIIASDDGSTTAEGVYAGGDAVTGAATVISAMGMGKRAAIAIAEALTE
jgi:glutamate synthase (NADPH/NADH) small chain